jgi:riboflavin kinase/FMN adenylyltransferase
MQIYRSLAEVPADFGPSALTIGNFDGVHTGHRRILRRLVELARQSGWKASVLTFDPHPTRVVAPERTPPLLTTPVRRAEVMSEEGVEQVLILPFDIDVARLSPERFVREIVVGRLGARAALVGANFRFGHRHAGDFRTLEEFGRRFGCRTEIVQPVFCRGRMVSSSAVRELLGAGRVAMAARFLERPYAIEGEVEAGRGIGSKQTVPTLNLQTDAEVVPARGVYVTRTRGLEDGRKWDSLTNIGYRPTFGESGERTVETFLLDRLEGGPPRRISVKFLERLRDERKFESAEALKARILADVGVARRYFRRRGAL